MPRQFNAGPPIGPVSSKDELLTAIDAHGMDSAKKEAILSRYDSFMAEQEKPEKPGQPSASQGMGAFFKRIMGDDKTKK